MSRQPRGRRPPRFSKSVILISGAGFIVSLVALPYCMLLPTHGLANSCDDPAAREGAAFQNSTLTVDDSLEAPGLGLFVARHVPDGTIICAYCGSLLTLHEILRAPDHTYAMAFTIDRHVDAGPHPHVLARYANHAFEPHRRNTIFVRDTRAGLAFLRTTRDLWDGDEVLTDYGETYWKGTCPSPPVAGVTDPPTADHRIKKRTFMARRARDHVFAGPLWWWRSFVRVRLPARAKLR